MKLPLSCLASFFAIFIIVIVVYRTPPQQYAGGHSDPDNEMEGARQRSEELDSLWADFNRHEAARQEIVQALAARRLSLLEAAARFRDLHRAEPESQQLAFHKYAPGDSDGERYCRAVLRGVETWLPDGERKVVL